MWKLAVRVRLEAQYLFQHIDGNSKNNKEENLTLLCPNCHSLTKTYKGANRGNGRYIEEKDTMMENHINAFVV